jgi:hypothetical protein
VNQRDRDQLLMNYFRGLPENPKEEENMSKEGMNQMLRYMKMDAEYTRSLWKLMTLEDQQQKIKGIYHSFLEDCDPLVAYYETVQHILIEPPSATLLLLQALQEEYELIHKEEK